MTMMDGVKLSKAYATPGETRHSRQVNATRAICLVMFTTVIPSDVTRYAGEK